MKKLISFVVSLSLVVSSLCGGALAASSDTHGPEDEYVKNSSYGRNAVTVADIDSLVGDLNKAILSDDVEAENEIRDELSRSGAIPTTYSEVLELTGSEVVPYATNVNIEFNTVYSDIIVGGKTIEIMRIYATPERGSDMFHEGNANSDDSPNMKAGAVNAIKTWGSFGAGYIPVVGTLISVYDALKDTVTGFLPNNVVEDIYIEYVYRCIENTTFLYFWNENSNNWTHMGTCSRLGARVTSIIDDITIDNFAALPGGYEETYYDDIYARNYNNAAYSYNYWWSCYGPNFEQQAPRFSISGAAGEDEEVAVVKMVMPELPGYCR